ncbi:CBS domain-containing protein [Acidisoma cellulosilytica]|uniref:CBS domain-containing protein n=1 Tax=Acidisoma cellulosilyticum TaxID=2802395 RepID=A0A963YZE6_9PROT|nr:CBS domain-containing protein [Acidisoma cellulosilyticum]MCB8879973.1 CBS domain-containing protein [Acidisoma cellulosilyticum]
MLQARDIMTTPVETVGPDARIETVIGLMVAGRLSGVPVVTKTGEIMGIVTEGDLLRRVETGTDHGPGRKHMNFLEFLVGSGKEITQYIHSHSRRVSDLMTETVITVTEDTPVTEIVRLMEQHKVRRLPVEQAGRLIGIVSRSDLVVALGRKLAEIAPAAGSDAEIEARIHGALEAAPWFAQSDVDVRVAGGIATLEGVIHDERLRTAIRVAVETVPGLVGLEDKIVFVEPMTGAVYPT